MGFTVSISGNIGVGKSTLITSLKELNVDVSEEDTKNPETKKLLTEYYQNLDKQSFINLQTHFANERILMFKEIKEKGGFIERCVGEDRVFVRSGVVNGIVTEEEANKFIENFSEEEKKVGLPDVVVFLKCSTKGLLRNIEERGREEEKKISSQYLEVVEDEYDKFMEEICPLTKILFVENEPGNFIDATSLIEAINKVKLRNKNGYYNFRDLSKKK